MNEESNLEALREEIKKVSVEIISLTAKRLSLAKKIGETKHSRLPIVDDKNRLLGIVDSVEINNLLSKVLK